MQGWHEMLAHQRVSPRWKEWIPLASQQLRLRNLIQIIAYNVSIVEEVKGDLKSKAIKSEKVKSSFYYTLHLTTMSAPFYTSEKLETENPKWAEVEIGDIVNDVNASVNGIVVRLWVHRNTDQDQVLTVWGVYFNGLVYLGPKLCSDSTAFCLNAIIFQMQGGYFTAPQCCKEPTLRLRHSQIKINAADVRPSYTVSLVSRLHTIQQAIKKQRYAAQTLREKISVGGYTAPESRESATLRRLLNKNRPRAPQRQEVLKHQQEIEMTKFRVEMLGQEKARKMAELQHFEKSRVMLEDINHNRATELLHNSNALCKEMELLKEKKKAYIEIRDDYLMTNAQLIFRQKQLISKLSQIYPIIQLSDGKFDICGVHLPNSEDFAGNDEIMISVSLGYVAHILQMISVFLQVPLRYPIIHFGSWSKIIDHVVEKIPEKDREFPLFSRGKDRLQFNYGVYLLNKNVSQLRWYCGLPTHDLRATLPNLSGLINIHPTTVPEFHYHLDHHHNHTSSGSSWDLRNSLNQSPVSSVESKKLCSVKEATKHFEKGHRVSRSVDSSEINFQNKLKESDVEEENPSKTCKSQNLMKGPTVTTSLSYSLDKGLDEYEELKKAEVPSKLTTTLMSHATRGRPLALVGSEPILTQELRDNVQRHSDMEVVSSGDDAKKNFLQNWQAGGPAPVCSDDEVISHSQPHHSNLFSKSLQTENSSKQIVLQNGNTSHDNISIKANMSEFSKIEEEKVKGNFKPLFPDMNFVSLQSSECMPCNELSINDDCVASNLMHKGELRDEEETTKHKGDIATISNCDCVLKVEEVKQHESIPCPRGRGLQNGKNHSSNFDECHKKNSVDEAVALEEINSLIDNSILVDSVFASVASRTEALANRSGTFNLVRSRHGSMLEDGNS